jgi:hypothetical protein
MRDVFCELQYFLSERMGYTDKYHVMCKIDGKICEEKNCGKPERKLIIPEKIGLERWMVKK